MEHDQQHCCGTTCDKASVAAYIEKLESEREELIDIATTLWATHPDSKCFRENAQRLRAIVESQP